MGSKGSSPKPTPPTATEIELQKEQLALSQLTRGTLEEYLGTEVPLSAIPLLELGGWRAITSGPEISEGDRAQLSALQAQKNQLQAQIDRFNEPADTSSFAGKLKASALAKAKATELPKLQQQMASLDQQIGNIQASVSRITGFEQTPLPGEQFIQQAIEQGPQLTQLRDIAVSQAAQTLENPSLGPIAEQARAEVGAPSRYQQAFEDVSAASHKAYEDINAPSEMQGLYDITRSRAEAVQRGEVPLSEPLLQELNRRETALRERLRKQMGTGFETSTGGATTLGEFEYSRARTLDDYIRSERQYATDQTVALGAFIESQKNSRVARATALSGALTGVGGAMDAEATGRMARALSATEGVDAQKLRATSLAEGLVTGNLSEIGTLAALGQIPSQIRSDALRAYATRNINATPSLNSATNSLTGILNSLAAQRQQQDINRLNSWQATQNQGSPFGPILGLATLGGSLALGLPIGTALAASGAAGSFGSMF
jgi:hypothetical protein